MIDKVAREDGIFVAHLIVEPAQNLEVVLGARQTEVDLAALIGLRRGLENSVYDVQRHRVELRGFDGVVDEYASGSRQVQLPAVAADRSVGGPVALQHLRGGEEVNRGGGGAEGGSLVACEKEQLVLLDRPANGSAKLVAFHRIANRLE